MGYVATEASGQTKRPGSTLAAFKASQGRTVAHEAPTVCGGNDDPI